LTVIGIALLTVEAVPTAQAMVAPPPFAEPLHWVTVAVVVAAGKGLQFTVPPPPAPEPTHWLTVAAVTGRACGVLLLMLFVMVTSQVIGCAASLSEPLHWLTDVTRSVELLVNVPFGDEHGPRVQVRVTVVVELVLVPRIVFTTVTEQVSPVDAPSAAGPCPLHWSMVTVAAWADGEKAATAKEKTPAIIRATIAACPARRRAEPGARSVFVALLMGSTGFLERRDEPQPGRHERESGGRHRRLRTPPKSLASGRTEVRILP
jgi:hypothetical protein